jgi:transposase
LKQESKEKMGKTVIIDGIKYGTYSDAAKKIGVSVATISLWSKKKSNQIVEKNGNKYNIEFRTGAM